MHWTLLNSWGNAEKQRFLQFVQAGAKLGPDSFKFDLHCRKQSPPCHLACIANHPAKPCIFMKAKYKSYLEPRGDVTNQWNNYPKPPEDRMCMVIYGSAGGKSVVEEQCEDTYSSKRWHLFLLAARSSFLQSSKESNYTVLYTSERKGCDL